MASMERGGFEPPKAYAGRFTVCSLWPLGHLSVNGAGEWARGADGRSRTADLLITSQLLSLMSYIGRAAPCFRGGAMCLSKKCSLETPPRASGGACHRLPPHRTGGPRT